MVLVFISRVTIEIVLQKHSTMRFLIAIYHSGPCKLFHFLKSADWYGFYMLRTALSSEVELAQCPKYLQSKDAGDSLNSRKPKGTIRAGNH